MSQNGRPTMDPKEFGEIRKQLGFSMDGFAIELGYEGTPNGNRETIKRFLCGKRPIPLPVAKLAWLISRTGIPTWPQELTAAPAKISEIRTAGEEVNVFNSLEGNGR